MDDKTTKFEDLKIKLGVNDFSEINENHLPGVGEYLSNVDRDTAIQIVSQISNLTALLAGTIAQIAEAFHVGLKENNESMRTFYENQSKVMDAYLEELKKSPSAELKAEILLKIDELSKRIALKDSENKEFLQKSNDGLWKILGPIAGGLLAIGGAVAYNKYQESQRPKSLLERILK